MKTKIAIYGTNRLGRAVYNIASRRGDLEIVTVATDESPDNLVKLLAADPVYAPYERNIVYGDDYIEADGKRSKLIDTKVTTQWSEGAVDVVIDCLATRASNAAARAHRKAGAKKVIFAGEGPLEETVILGVNEEVLSGRLTAISCGGTESSAVRPILSILEQAFDVKYSNATTLSGNLAMCDIDKSVCSCSCGTKCGGNVCLGPREGDSLPLPVLSASLSILSVVMAGATTAEKVNSALIKASKEPYFQGIVSEVASINAGDEVIGESASAIVDKSETSVDGNLVSVKIWYDREWSYANRITEIAADFGRIRSETTIKE